MNSEQYYDIVRTTLIMKFAKPGGSNQAKRKADKILEPWRKLWKHEEENNRNLSRFDYNDDRIFMRVVYSITLLAFILCIRVL